MAVVPFDAFIRVAAKGAIMNFARYKHVEPIFMTMSADGKIEITAFKGWRDDAMTKEKAFAAMREIAKKNNATRCAFISEAWTLDGDDVGNDAVLRAWKGESLEHVPGRRETVQIMAEDDTEGARNAWMEIVRPEGREPYLLKLHIESFKESIGRGVGLLPAKVRAS